MGFASGSVEGRPNLGVKLHGWRTRGFHMRHPGCSHDCSVLPLCLAQISRRTGNRARNNNVSAKKILFAIAKLSFPKGKFGQILAREFGQIRVSCGFRYDLIGAVFCFFVLRLSQQALQS